MRCNVGWQPSSTLKFIDQSAIWLSEVLSMARSRVDHLTSAGHLCGNLSHLTSHRGSQYRHTQSSLGVLRDTHCTTKHIGAELATVAATGPAAGETQLAANRSTEQVKIIKTQPLDESYAL